MGKANLLNGGEWYNNCLIGITNGIISIIKVDYLLISLDIPDEHIDNLWRQEVEDRIKTYQSGRIKAVALEEVLSGYPK